MNCVCSPSSTTSAVRNAEHQTRGAASQSTETAPTFLAPVDMYETENDFVIVADVPGATSEDVDVQSSDGVLNLRARIAPRLAKDARSMLNEYRVGDFARSFRFGTDVDSTKITAELSAGVLTIRVPKAEEVRPRKIAVQSA